ncbi:extensin family protein [soil metagenome]
MTARSRSWIAPLVLLAIVAGIGAVAWQLRSGGLQIPYRFDPWARLDLSQSDDWLTRHRLARLGDEPLACREVLATTDFVTRALPDRTTGPGCGFDNAVEVRRSSLAASPSFPLSCRAAVSLALWEARVVKPAALAHFGVEATRIEHFGSYACRNIYNQPSARRSQHATADAFDVAGFVLANGRPVRVAADWNSRDPKVQAFLREVHDGACRYFDGVLGPEYNAAHADHFHLDRGGYTVCR